MSVCIYKHRFSNPNKRFFHWQNFVHPEVAEFIPLIMNTISLQPPQHLRQSPAFNKEVFVDFMGAQIKTLSFLAYIIR
jgi:transformation/transcription domain-associated protein